MTGVATKGRSPVRRVTSRGSAWVSLVVTNLKLYLREPAAAFFTVAFPVMLVLLFGAIYGNEPDELFGGYGAMDVTMPAYTALIVATVGLLGVAITTSTYRETGILRRFRVTPLRPIVYIAADVSAYLLMTLAGMGAVVVVGWGVFRVRFEGNLLLVLAGVVLSAAAMFAIGYLIAGLAPTARVAQVVGMALLYPMIFLSGAAIPLEVMPDTIGTVSHFLPLTYAVRLLRGLWFGDPLSSVGVEIGVLVALLVGATAIAARFFRWE